MLRHFCRGDLYQARFDSESVEVRHATRFSRQEKDTSPSSSATLGTCTNHFCTRSGTVQCFQARWVSALTEFLEPPVTTNSVNLVLGSWKPLVDGFLCRSIQFQGARSALSRICSHPHLGRAKLRPKPRSFKRPRVAPRPWPLRSTVSRPRRLGTEIGEQDLHHGHGRGVAAGHHQRGRVV